MLNASSSHFDPNPTSGGLKSRSATVSCCAEVCYPFGRKHGRHRAVKRREFIALIGGATATWPLAVRAQQTDRVRRGGVLWNFAESDPEAQSMVDALHQTLQELGWVEGRNLRIDRRWAAGNPTRLQAFAKALVALQPDVIVGHVTPAVIALRKE